MQVLTNSGSQLLSAFKEALSAARQVDIATAWATQGEALRLLKRCKPDTLRVIVGLHGNITTPKALRSLRQIASIRTPPNEPMFPRQSFRLPQEGRSKSGWVGSANLTHRGFGQNDEAVLEVADGGALSRWFDDQWTKCDPDASVLDRYCARYKPPHRSVDQGPPPSQPLTVPQNDLKSKHTRISSVLLEDPELDDSETWEVVDECFRPLQKYRRGDGWQSDMRWNRLYVYAAIRIVERLSLDGVPTGDTESVIQDWCAIGYTRLAAIFSVAIEQPVNPHSVTGAHWGESARWARRYVPILRELDASRRKYVCSTLVDRIDQTSGADKRRQAVDDPLLQGWQA